MKRLIALKASALAILGLVVASPALAESAPAFSNSTTVDVARWTTCYVLDRAAGKKWVSGIYEATAAQPVNEGGWVQYVRSKFGPSADVAGGCTVETTREDAIWRHAVLTDEDPVHPVAIVEVADWAPAFALRIADSPSPTETLETVAVAEVSEPVGVAPEPSPPAATTQPVALHEVRIADEAEFERQYADYQRRLAEQQRQVEAFRQAQADVARRKAEQRLAAAKAVAAYTAQMHAHEDVLRRHDAEVARYQTQLTTTTTASVDR